MNNSNLVLVLFFSISTSLLFCQNNLILGGEPINIEEVPWQVALGVLDEDGSFSLKCGGSIINEEWIVTAAHCDNVNAGDFVHAGTSIAGDLTQGFLVEIAEVIRHPNFVLGNHATVGYDVAVYRLQEPLCFDGDKVQPIEIANSSYTLDIGTPIQHTGYSSTYTNSNQLLEVDIPHIDNTTANSFSCSNTSFNLNSTMLAAAASGKAHSSGDSGGPAVHYSPQGIPTLVGAISWVDICQFGSSDLHLSVSANLIELSDWVNASISTPSISPTVLSGTLQGDYFSGPYILEGKVKIEGDCTISNNSLIYTSENSSLSISGDNVLITDVVFRNCGNDWEGIVINENANATIVRTAINDAKVGLELNESQNIYIENVVFGNCDIGILIEEEENDLNPFNLLYVKSINSPLHVTNASVNLKGCKFLNSELHFNNSITTIEEVTYNNWNLRSAFYNSETFLNGGSYGNMLSYFSDSPINTVTSDGGNLGFFNVSHCYFDSQGLEIENVDEWQILKNVFPNSRDNGFSVLGDSGSSLNKIEENVFNQRDKDIQIESEFDVKISCNYHQRTKIIPYTTPELIAQGSDNQPAGNIFNTQNLSVDIAPENPYLYYTNSDIPITVPKLASLSDLFLNDVSLTDGSYQCRKISEILGPWNEGNVDLCPPSQWLNNFDCYDICTLCIDDNGGPCTNIPTGNNGSAGKLSNQNNPITYAHQGNPDGSTANKISIRQTENSLILNQEKNLSGRRFTMFDKLGHEILRKDFNDSEVSITLDNLPSGLYFGVITSDQSGISETFNILLP